MPVYKLQGPDGKVYTIEGPDGATADQLASFITPQGKAPTEAPINPTEGMSGLEKFMAGAGKAVSDTGMGVGQLVGKTSRADVEEVRKRDAPLMDTGAGIAGNVAGNIAMFLLPGGAAVQGGRLLSKVPAAAKYAEALMSGGRALMAPKSIPQAAVVGAGQGAIQPSTSTGETLMNTGIGGAASVAAPLVVRGGQVAKAALDPFSEAGQQRIIGRAMNTAAGNDATQALQNLRTAVPLVPGSMPTAGQAAGNPGIAALERTATATDPVAMNEMARRMALQNEARVSALGGAAPDRAAAVTAREAATSPLYQSAYGQQLAVTPEIAALLERPSMQGALGRGQSLASEQGQALTMRPPVPAQPPVPSPILNAQGQPMAVTPGAPAVPGAMTGRDAHLMKMGLDDMANAAPMSGIGGNELRAIQGTRGEFLGEIEKQIPQYGQARQTYAQMSRPVSQADVIEEISKRATNHRGDMTPAAYARALRDETAQSVTGQANATLAKTMDPAQMQTLQAIKDDLLRADFAQTAGRGVGSDTVQKLAYSNLMDKSGLPNMVRGFPGMGSVGGIVQRVADAGYGRANKEMSSKLAQALLNPQDAAALMEAGVVTPQVQMLIDGLRRGGAGAGAAAPYLLNATKE